jgi:alkanesulfonate monooxygenase SsuD/methylene tetrahydromethanopterin reductase-like flavin-dependent oxidoreductase (luciferase family)
VGPGSSQRDCEAVGADFEGRWSHFDDAVRLLRSLLRGEAGEPNESFAAPDGPLAPAPARPVPVLIGSWGSPAGLRRVA